MDLFKGKVALVTGAASGIGRACAIAFAREGAKVVVGDRKVKEGEETVKFIEETGSKGLFVQTDVSQEAQVKNLIEQTLATFGRLDYACNNAGIEQSISQFTEITETTYDQIMGINVKGIWLSMKYEIPALLQNGGGAIVNVSSSTIYRPVSGVPIYIASKHAIIGLTKATALEYAQSGIRINAICPGAVDTELLGRIFPGETRYREIVSQMHAMGRIGQVEEIANGVIWLCSDQASFMTGQPLVIDGGHSL
jgi:NAD(P)-dependent dehydrogenase (short-subunit alcohol dehydrogenase family)